MVTRKSKHILIAPLDWGLGHTTRCIPLIRYLSDQGHIPVFASNNAQRSFIEETFGSIDFIHLDGYDITYSAWNKFGQAGLLSQLPHIQKAIRAEHQWLQQLVAHRHIDGIISDNRYGLYSQRVPSVILTHQLRIRSGLGSLADSAVQKIHYRYLNKFNATWVVDVPGTPNLAGDLSHAPIQPHHTKYIGLLSGLNNNDAGNNTDGPLVVLLSGPEPQRTALSRLLWQQVQHYDGKVIFIEGRKSATPYTDVPAHISYHPIVSGKVLEAILRRSGMVICRSGYSTLMDLVALQKKAILIPTPGQTEQLYLARLMQQQGIFCSMQQSEFTLDSALKKAAAFPYHTLPLQQSYRLFTGVLNDWLNAI